MQEARKVDQSRGAVHRSANIEEQERLPVLINLHGVFDNRIEAHKVTHAIQAVNA